MNTSLVVSLRGAKRRSNLFIAAVLIFAACLYIGFWIAGHKPLWMDENYSQIASVQRISFTDQFLGRIPEGCNSPLFYSIQKLFLQLNPFSIPSQILLRINPVVFMSLSVSLVFYYFGLRYSLGIGFLSLFIFMSSHMLWAYWAQARPYALLVFLTTVQAVVFLEGGSWVMLAGANILLSLTSILSLGGILAVSLLWGIFKDRDWKKFIPMTLVPIVIVLFYYVQAPKYSFFFGFSKPHDLIYDNISKQCFYILLISLPVYFVGYKIFKPLPYFIFMVLVLASSIAVLGLFAWHAQSGSRGFPITSRYFIYLTPVGVIATTILSSALFKSFPKHHLIRWIVIGLTGFLLTQHFLKTFHNDIRPIMIGTA